MSPSRWESTQLDGFPNEPCMSETGLPEPLIRLLFSRGYTTRAAVEQFIDPRLSDLSDPFGLPDVDKAVARIWSGIDAGERLTVFGDYDVDGVTSTALMFRVLRALGADVSAFIPDRLDEGYGLSSDAVQRCLEEFDPHVILSVDCGVNSVESVAMVQAKGVDVIVSDHHEPEPETAPAYALINPKLGNNTDHQLLSGVGVAFKLAHALVKRGRTENRTAASAVDLRDYLDLVALGTAADMVPLLGENRILVRHGLERFASSKWIGLEALKRVAGIRGALETYHLGFQIGPRINAAGRIGEPMQALQLLITDNQVEAKQIAERLDETNSDRRRIEKEMADEAFREIECDYNPERHFGLVVAQTGWHPGVVGIVASRVARHYNRPAIVMGIEEDGCARGSCRSIEGYNILEGLEACRKHMSSFGGHAMAAGLVVRAGELDAFKHAFNVAAAETLSHQDLSPVLKIDAEIDPHRIDRDFWEHLQRLQPFGQANPEPVWMMRNARVSGSPRVVGNKHLKLTLVAADCSFEAIAFNYPLEQLPAGCIDVAFSLKENDWNGNRSLQLQVKDIRPISSA